MIQNVRQSGFPEKSPTPRLNNDNVMNKLETKK
jgi:hypothetical protein